MSLLIGLSGRLHFTRCLITCSAKIPDGTDSVTCDCDIQRATLERRAELFLENYQSIILNPGLVFSCHIMSRVLLDDILVYYIALKYMDDQRTSIFVNQSPFI